MLNVALWWMFRFACTTYFDYLAGAGPEASRRCVATRVGGFTLCDSRRGTASCTESCRAFGAQASDSVHCNRPGLVGYSFRTLQAPLLEGTDVGLPRSPFSDWMSQAR